MVRVRAARQWRVYTVVLRPTEVHSLMQMVLSKHVLRVALNMLIIPLLKMQIM